VTDFAIIDEPEHNIRALLGYYAESSGNSWPAFRDNLSVGPIVCPVTPVRN